MGWEGGPSSLPPIHNIHNNAYTAAVNLLDIKLPMYLLFLCTGAHYNFLLISNMFYDLSFIALAAVQAGIEMWGGGGLGIWVIKK